MLTLWEVRRDKEVGDFWSMRWGHGKEKGHLER
jgi:hypothetical protein